MNRKHLHFMGIGGVSMSALARHLASQGHQVSGCDICENDAMAGLRASGIEAARGHDPSHLEGVDRLVVTMAVDRDHPEMVAARRLGIPTIYRIDLLAELFTEHRAIGVTGTHGKSTTTGMIAQIFLAAGRDPSVQLGATLPALPGNMRVGKDPELIAEVDESDPGFARLRPAVAVIVNLEDDHVAGEHSERRNYHASLEDLQTATRTFASAADRVVACGDWPGLTELLRGMPGLVSYGVSEDVDFRIEEAQLSQLGSRFMFRVPGGQRVPVKLVVPGLHNIRNAAAALTVAYLEGIDIAVASEALGRFGGVGRRWQRWSVDEGALIIDDYAHHPTEVAATLEAARNTGRRVRAVLQPHRWVRTARHWPALADAAGLADEVIVLDVYAAGETAIPGVTVDLIVDRLRSLGKSAWHHDHQSAVAYLKGTLHEDDLVITLGAGDVWKVAQALALASLPGARVEGVHADG